MVNKVRPGKNGCIEWVGAKQKFGYGVVGFDNRIWLAHRLSLCWFLGEEIGPDEMVCHTCDNPSCVNPEHLYRGSHASNMRDKSNRGRTRNGWTGPMEPSIAL